MKKKIFPESQHLIATESCDMISKVMSKSFREIVKDLEVSQRGFSCGVIYYIESYSHICLFSHVQS